MARGALKSDMRADIPKGADGVKRITPEQMKLANRAMKANYDSIKAHPAVYDIAETGNARGDGDMWIVSLEYGYQINDGSTSFGARNYSDAVKQIKEAHLEPEFRRDEDK
jgi:hypothetical protein